ncbi:MAG: HAMP domain-containing histidine kinase [Candidatus Aminicenantes bacterium]|nr:HAMP domain-containing histidine kinase [Candidatus Aminicenantes bacterium]
MAKDIADREESRLRFTAIVAHDLRNPIVSIGMAARLLKQQGVAEDDAQRWLDMIARNARSLEAMASELTENAQVSAGKFSLRRSRVELINVMRRLTEESATVHEEHDLIFEGNEECPVFGDVDKLRRVALNLISNAAK